MYIKANHFRAVVIIDQLVLNIVIAFLETVRKKLWYIVLKFYCNISIYVFSLTNRKSLFLLLNQQLIVLPTCNVANQDIIRFILFIKLVRLKGKSNTTCVYNKPCTVYWQIKIYIRIQREKHQL